VRAHVTVTSRAGGVSRSPYDGNNLALHVGDDPAAVADNRRRLASSLVVDRVQFMTQVHGAQVRVVDAAVDDIDGVDALVTATPRVALAVLVADCVPVVVWGTGAVAVAHAGRRGVAGGVVPATVHVLRTLDDGPLQALVGASICGRCYEVPPAMQDEVARVAPEARTQTRHGTPALDLPAAVRAQLTAAGVDVQPAPCACTFEDDRYYSHRRDGVTGRFAAVGMLAE